MPSLFNSAEKTAIQNILSDVADTFERDVYVYINEAQDVGVDANYNPVYSRYNNESKGVTDRVLTKYTISARVHYMKMEEEEVLNDTGLPSSENIIRLKVKSAALEKLKNAEAIEVDGTKCSIASDAEGIGPFDNQYYKIYVRRDS